MTIFILNLFYKINNFNIFNKFLRHLLGVTKLDKEKKNALGKKKEHRI